MAERVPSDRRYGGIPVDGAFRESLRGTQASSISERRSFILPTDVNIICARTGGVGKWTRPGVDKDPATLRQVSSPANVHADPNLSSQPPPAHSSVRSAPLPPCRLSMVRPTSCIYSRQ